MNPYYFSDASTNDPCLLSIHSTSNRNLIRMDDLPRHSTSVILWRERTRLRGSRIKTSFPVSLRASWQGRGKRTHESEWKMDALFIGRRTPPPAPSLPLALAPWGLRADHSPQMRGHLRNALEKLCDTALASLQLFFQPPVPALCVGEGAQVCATGIGKESLHVLSSVEFFFHLLFELLLLLIQVSDQGSFGTTHRSITNTFPTLPNPPFQAPTDPLSCPMLHENARLVPSSFLPKKDG